MCMYTIKIRGVQILGRQAYLTDAGVKLGFMGPVVPVSDAIRQLSIDKANALAEAVEAINSKLPEILTRRRERWEAEEREQDEIFGRYEEDSANNAAIDAMFGGPTITQEEVEYDLPHVCEEPVQPSLGDFSDDGYGEPAAGGAL